MSCNFYLNLAAWLIFRCLALSFYYLSLKSNASSQVVAIIKGVVNMTSTHYPQRSHKMLVLNVPGWFGFLFNIVKPLLNDAQKAKINIFRAHEVNYWILQGKKRKVYTSVIRTESVFHVLISVLRLHHILQTL